MSSTAEKIKKLRMDLCVNQTEFAKMIGVHKSVVSFYETGRSKPGFSTLRKLIEVMKKKGIIIKPEQILSDK